MQAIRQTETVQTKQELGFERADYTNCAQVREKLDFLFNGKAQLEATQNELKRKLFRHLETCSQCCRSFDVRVRCNSFPRGGIY